MCSVVERDVTYAVRTPQNPNNSNFSEAIDLSEINSSHPVILIVHGWTDTGNDPWIQNLTYAYFSQGNYNIIAVDWRKPAGHNYIASVENSRPVGNKLNLHFQCNFILLLHFSGNIVGDTIISICKIKNISLKQFHIIGHSLGAHVVGFAAKRVINVTGTKINWVTGLDPAGPLFEIPPQSKNNRLNNNDGNVVEIIHSDGGILGYFSPLGTIDFFPNGGRFIQPNCNDTNVNIFNGLYNQGIS